MTEEIREGVTEGATVEVSNADLFRFDHRLPDNERVEQTVELSGPEYAAAFGIAIPPTRMDRMPCDPPLKHQGLSALDVFNGRPGTKIGGVLDSVRQLEEARNGEG